MISTRVTNLARAAFFAATLVLPFLFFLVVKPIFAAPNTFEDGQGYLASAQRLLATGSPYQDWQLAGPYGSVTSSDTFRYPPPFAQIAALFAQTGTGWLLLVILVATCFLAPLVLARSRRQVALALWLGLAFMPDWTAAWNGQVTGLLTIAVAFALCEFPAAIWAGVALKVTPILALPAAILRMPRAVVTSAVVLFPFLAASVIISPVAWAQFPTVLVNEFLGGTDHTSLAPAGLARYAVLAVVGVSLLASLPSPAVAGRSPSISRWPEAC